MASAADITGTVSNKTTNKASAGEDVVLISLTSNMAEVARTKTDGKGAFTLKFSDDGAQHLVRVTHQGVNYFRPAPQGTTSVELEVYDSAKKVDGIVGKADIMRLQADNNQVTVTEMYVLENRSQPPRAQMSDRSFEIVLPQGSVVDSALAKGPGGMPVNSSPVPTDQKDHYAFLFPLRPGETRFQVQYHMPYSGSLELKPQVASVFESLAVMTPKSISFKNGSSFEPQGEDNGVNIFVAKNVAPGQALAFSVSGTGTVPDEDPQAPQGGEAAAGGAPRPGGGIGVPENTPHPLQKAQWYILAAVLAALAVGGYYMMTLKPAAAAAPLPDFGAVGVARAGHVGASTGQNGLLLSALKEELFQLETERLEGKISQQEYDQAKAAFDLIIRHSMKRGKLKETARA
jgi:CBS domain-containing protein